MSSLSPQSGTWGTEVTIDGAHFGGVPGASNVVVFDGAVGANGFVVETWNDNEIRGRIAFPASGAMSVETAFGQTDAGTFTTTEPWQPSASIDVAQLVAEAVLSTGDAVALYREYELANQATLAVFGGSHAGAFQLAGVADPASARLVEADDHSPEVIATKQDGTVAVFAFQGTALTATATGLTGTVVAAARDATGVYAWIDTGSGIVRARPGATWTVDRGPIASAHAPLDGAVAADGTLWITVSEPGPPTSAYVSLQTLGPTAPQFGALERADPTSHADTISQAQLLLASDGMHAVVLATADAGGTPTPLTPRMRTAPSTWSDAPAVTGLVQYAFAGTTLGALANDSAAKTTSLVPDVTMPSSTQTIPVWPMQSAGFAIDGSGKAHPLIGNGTVTYALTPP